VTVTKAQTRGFFLGGTGVFTLVFIALTLHTHSTIEARTRGDRLTPQVASGLKVWGRYNCENCHTLMGEGAYFAPDLTHIVSQRGGPYLKQFLDDPSRFYSEEEHGRLMPRLGLSASEIEDVIAFLDWVGQVDMNGWPPRPIHVQGASVRGIPGVSPPQGGGDLASSRGKALFNEQAACASCHAVEPGRRLVGPSLAGAATTAEGRLKEPAYKGQARTAGDYLRESIITPDAYLVEGAAYSGGGKSLMPPHYAQMLEPSQVEDLVAYLLTLR
jgi:nitric oxide reductase subunit C